MCTVCRYYGVEERIELWGLQIPHNSVRPTLTEEGDVAVVRGRGGEIQAGISSGCGVHVGTPYGMPSLPCALALPSCNVHTSWMMRLTDLHTVVDPAAAARCPVSRTALQ